MNTVIENIQSSLEQAEAQKFTATERIAFHDGVLFAAEYLTKRGHGWERDELEERLPENDACFRAASELLAALRSGL